LSSPVSSTVARAIKIDETNAKIIIAFASAMSRPRKKANQKTNANHKDEKYHIATLFLLHKPQGGLLYPQEYVMLVSFSSVLRSPPLE
jgi:hypothetical protein